MKKDKKHYHKEILRVSQDIQLVEAFIERSKWSNNYTSLEKSLKILNDELQLLIDALKELNEDKE